MRCIQRIVVLSLLLCALLLGGAAAEEYGILTLPAGLKVIEEEAFLNDTSLEAVVIPEGTARIDSMAFAGSSASFVVLPDSI